MPEGCQHSFHQETKHMGLVDFDFRQFTKGPHTTDGRAIPKNGYEGRLSMVTESPVHNGGVHRYYVQFLSNCSELSPADGVGFVFSSKLPCAKNVQKIVSVYLNQRGCTCLRVFDTIVRGPSLKRPLELGDWIEMTIDLTAMSVRFNIWPSTSTGD